MKRKTPFIPESYLISLLLLLLSMGGSHVLFGNPFLGAVLFLLLSVVLTLVPKRKGVSSFQEIASYRVYSNMVFYTILAMNLGALMCVCHLLSPFEELVLRDYLSVGFWILLVAIAEWGCNRLLRNQKIVIGFGTFMTGALIWIVADCFMFRTSTEIIRIMWTFVWGFGIALVTAGLRHFAEAFVAVGILEGQMSQEDLKKSNNLVTRMAALVSSMIMIAVMLLWYFLTPAAKEGQLPLILRICQVQLPLIPMIIAIIASLNQPLDERSYEKLMIYLDGEEGDERIRENLRSLFVRKYRVRYAVKILTTMARPVLRLKVSGKENLRKKEYPSVFVCNHGFIYGPISAVMYLPTYFRPWIHDAMLDEEKTVTELSYSMPHLPKHARRILAKLVIRVLNSYNPIPVVRGNSHDVMDTLNRSLSALEDGDNLLIFPELPNPHTKYGDPDQDSSDLRSFYTGFAHIGKMYFEKTGQCLLFYPLYTDSEKREFRIGEPVRYDPEKSSRDSKVAIASELHSRMETLSGKAAQADR